MNRYGLPYMGSKNKIANWVVDTLPPATHLYDLFCGGCAVTHAAMLQHKFGDYHINDISNVGGAFHDIVKGIRQPDFRWVSREEFHRLKNIDPIVGIVWSFGNNRQDYLYGKDREEMKKAMHYAVVFGDYSMSDALGIDLHSLDDYEGLEARYAAYKKIYTETMNRVDKTPPLYCRIENVQRGVLLSDMQSDFNSSNNNFKKKKMEPRLQAIERILQIWNASFNALSGGDLRIFH